MLSNLALSLLLMGAPVKLAEVTDGAAVKAQLGKQVAVLGVLERVELSKGKAAWAGTALVLDDDTRIYVTYDAPPTGWEPLVGTRIRVEGLLSNSMSEKEQSLMAPHLRAPGAPFPAPRSLKSVLGKRVRLSGTARDAKGGAVLLIESSPVYLAGLDAWPAEAEGKQVVVGGTLVDKQYLPQATRNAKGEWSQGAQGSQLVLETPSWRLPQESK